MKYLFDSIKNPKYKKYYLKLNINQDNKKQQKLVGRVLLSELLNLPVNELINDKIVNFDKLGRPIIDNNNLFFSISHSHELVVVVVSDEEIGVDLEMIRPFSFNKIKKAFTDNEIDYLKENPSKTLTLWTIKEAVLKLLGVGLMGRPQSVHVDLINFNIATRKNEKFKVNNLLIDKDYICTIVKKKHSN
ncbi:4'-phosphopantetheinyl transferase superfamily protein [Lactobacillus sp. S2-2]|uniref:4'-phosphopantetheinyl transferase family protein n=1 Tax=Lactobacillus sp. S2-2 TaxID=2692917 RepID=UPI001F015A60|nr:4'-phosphopantetheinyl transferase superfamily protein [Lactobacillus sp. S2-2]MCF6514667.1 4'-phosphopantetheinyl transferase superfamily protein [Lactobacillus sp. S2-2]